MNAICSCGEGIVFCKEKCRKCYFKQPEIKRKHKIRHGIWLAKKLETDPNYLKNWRKGYRERNKDKIVRGTAVSYIKRIGKAEAEKIIKEVWG